MHSHLLAVNRRFYDPSWRYRVHQKRQAAPFWSRSRRDKAYCICSCTPRYFVASTASTSTRRHKSVGTSCSPRDLGFFCRQFASATIPMFARRTFADGEGGRLAAVRRGQARPRLSIGRADTRIASRHGRTRKPYTPASPKSWCWFTHRPSVSDKKVSPTFFPLWEQWMPPLVSSVRAVATRQGWLPGGSVIIRRNWLANRYASSRTTDVPSRACLLDNVRQCDRCGLPWDHGMRPGRDNLQKTESPAPAPVAYFPLLPYTPYTSHHAVTRSAIDPAVTRCGRACNRQAAPRQPNHFYHCSPEGSRLNNHP